MLTLSFKRGDWGVASQPNARYQGNITELTNGCIVEGVGLHAHRNGTVFRYAQLDFAIRVQEEG